MALKPCKECGKEISTEAKTCPHCGKRNPTISAMEPSRGVKGCLIIFVVLAVIGGISESITKSSSPAAVPFVSTGAEIMKSRPRADSLLGRMSSGRIKAASDSTLSLIVIAADSTKAPALYHAAKVELDRRTGAESAKTRLATVLGETRSRTADGKHCAKGTSGRVERLLTKYPFWDNDDVVTVACGWIREGLTEAQIRESWGPPDHVNRSQGSFGVHDQWVYGESGYAYVYFEDGVVTSWQTSR